MPTTLLASAHRATGILVELERHRSTVNGNPQWTVHLHFAGAPVSYRTKPDASVAGMIDNHRLGREITVALDAKRRIIDAAYADEVA